MRIPYHGTTPYLGKYDGPFYRLFHIISTPYLWNLSQFTPYLGNITMTPIPFLLFYFLRALEICVRSLPLPSRGPTTDMQRNKDPIPFSREAIECSGNMYV